MLVVVLLGMSIITFVLSHVVPGDPARLIAGPQASQEYVERARRYLGLDKPLHIQYLVYMNGLLHGDLGNSIRTRRPVLDDLLTYFPATLELTTFAMMLTILIAIPLGILAASSKDKLPDHATRLVTIMGVGIPPFLIGLVMQLLFAYEFPILPGGGRIDASVLAEHPIGYITGIATLDSLLTANWPALTSSVLHLIMPAFSLACASLAVVTRMMRSSMLEVLGQDYVRTSTAFGFPKRIVHNRYALKNALGPVVTSIGLAYGFFLSGSFLVETIFDWPGIGLYAVESVINLDYPGIMGVCMLCALIYVVINLTVDLAYSLLDPRVRYG